MKSAGVKVFSFIIVLALATLACAVPGVDALLNPLPKDDFSSDGSGWGTGTDSQSLVEYANGGLQMIVYTPFYITWSTPDVEVYENVHIEASVTNTSSDPEALFGIICDAQTTTSAFYYVGVSPDGYYAFIEKYVALDDVFLKEGTSDVISASAGSMRIGLDCGGGALTLYVNGQQIDTVATSTYTSGSVGLFAATDDQESGVNVTFDDFVVTKLGE
ncbi:MAG: hypothetical protein H7Y59_09690 [Anaerolineales bacterium]|nr:hypothetical protein [Anaerolineales bacterium]